MTELHHLDDLRRHLDGHLPVDGLVVQGVDLGPLAVTMTERRWDGATFLGCALGSDTVRHVTATGGTWFPPFDGLPYDPYRGTLYTQAELEADDDAIHRHAIAAGRNPPILEALAQRIHDHAIDDALAELLAQHPAVVAIMGGHRLARTDDVYRDVAIVARSLTRSGFLIATGGGPGAMEAANLGAWLAPEPDTALDSALALLGAAPTYDVDGYVESARRVRARHPDGATSLAIPTWFYGHEPSNAFAPAIAKYFSNSIREDGLLAIATHGVVYMPGAAGTVQEIFMDATQNHYGTFHLVSPMVLYGTDHWTRALPAAPLLTALAGDRRYADLIAVVDDPDAAVRFVLDHPPVAYDDP